jgi:hypothetical protein
MVNWQQRLILALVVGICTSLIFITPGARAAVRALIITLAETWTFTGSEVGDDVGYDSGRRKG